jgi:superfamily II DNA or RNA helicase
MKQCKLIIRDAVNVRFEGLDVVVRKKMSDALRFMVPSARHMPQYKLGRWDGTVSFCALTGSTYFNLLDRLLPIIATAGFSIEVDDRRTSFAPSFPLISETMFADKVWPQGHEMAGQPIVLRDYQVDAIELFIRNLQSTQCIATGSGKTTLTAALSWLAEPYGRSIVIVPSKSLVVQTEADYRNLGLDVGVFFGDRKEYGHTHTIATWQSLSVFARKDRRDQMSIMTFIEGVVCVIIDEVHIAKANVLKNLLCGPLGNVPIRWGLTGTIPKAEHEAVSLLASIGPVVGQLRVADLQKRDVLANCNINIVQTNDRHVEFTDYDAEYKFLLTDKTRLRWAAKYIANLANDGNTLVLVNRIETGEQLKAMIPDAVFISGTTKLKARNKEYDEVKTANNKVIIATYGIASVGINVPRLFNCVLFESGRSFVRVVQAIGRILRRANDKTTATVIDLTSNLKFSTRHLAKRKEYYREAEYPFTVTKVNYKDS